MNLNDTENITEKTGTKYFLLLLIGSIRFFLCTAFLVIYKTSFYDIFEVLIRAYHTLETYLLPTIAFVMLPLLFVEYDLHKYKTKVNEKSALFCTVLWILATFVQIQFFKLPV